jgi:hypothetical protein
LRRAFTPDEPLPAELRSLIIAIAERAQRYREMDQP